MEMTLLRMRARAIHASSQVSLGAGRILRLLACVFLICPGVAMAQTLTEGKCGPLARMVRLVAAAGYVRVFYANEIAREPATVDAVETRSASSLRIRTKLESLVGMSLDAGTHAEQALLDGRIASGSEDRFVAEVRRRTYAALQAHASRAEWLQMLVDPASGKGIVLARRYVFPERGTAGLMNGAEQMCVRSRLEQVTLWPRDSPTLHPLLNGPERPDCGFASRASVNCAGLGSQLESAGSQGELVIATAGNGLSLLVFTADPIRRRGRVLRVSSNSTALVDTWLFNIEVPTQ